MDTQWRIRSRCDSEWEEDSLHFGRDALLRVRHSVHTTPQVFRLPGRARGPAAAGLFYQFNFPPV